MTPRVSIVTTVYDRMDCLRRCLRSVQHLQMRDFEQIVVSDCPGPEIEAEIDRIVAETADPRIRHIRRATRKNDWGHAPATDGYLAAAGEFVCFLSDDNAYLPDHFGRLVAAFDADPGLGFVYSSCLYNARKELRYCPPVGAGIDLGQPLFRTSMLRQHFGEQLPCPGVFSWDWELIRILMQDKGVRWQHVDELTFIFRLMAYPRLVEALA